VGAPTVGAPTPPQPKKIKKNLTKNSKKISKK
jgi:hypothetical protein